MAYDEKSYQRLLEQHPELGSLASADPGARAEKADGSFVKRDP